VSFFEGRPLKKGEILREENGRPYFSDRHADFNISHSGAMVAVSHIKDGKLRTGCDIQLIRTRANTMRIAKQFFSPSEQEYIVHNQTRFFELWTLKESFLKLRGLSVFDMASAPSFIDDSGNLRLVDGAWQLSFFVCTLDAAGQQYMLAAALEGAEGIQPEIHWLLEETDGAGE